MFVTVIVTCAVIVEVMVFVLIVVVTAVGMDKQEQAVETTSDANAAR